MFVYRDDAYDATKNPGVAEIIIAKQRNGPIDTLKLTFLKEYTRFEDYSGRDDEGYSDAEQS